MNREPSIRQLGRAWGQVLVEYPDDETTPGACYTAPPADLVVRVTRAGYLPVRMLAAAIGKGALTHRPGFTRVHARCGNALCCHPQHLDLRWHPPGGFDRSPEELEIVAAYAAWAPLREIRERFGLANLTAAHRIVWGLASFSPENSEIQG